MHEFTNSDRSSPVWDKVMSRVRDRILEAQRELEGNLDLDATNRVRGRLRELRLWEKLNVEDPIVP